jgi:hypothetical protein
MFQVTPEYPMLMRRFLAPVLFMSLVIWTLLMLAAIFSLIGDFIPTLWMLLVLPGFMLYAVVTLRLQQQRKRRIPDITMKFWRIGMFSILFSSAVWIIGNVSTVVANSPQYHLLLGVGLIAGAGVSVVNGMLYKIVPFLSWFHLQNRQLSLMCMTVQVPNMKEFISDKAARYQYNVYVASLFLLFAAVTKPEWFAHMAGLVFLLSNIMLFRNLVIAMSRYYTTNQALLSYAVDSVK